MEKAVIPQNVADYIEYCKTWNLSILNALRKNIDIAYDCAKWVRNNSDEFAKAWVNGYTIQEKYYYVAIPCGNNSYRHVFVNDSNNLVVSNYLFKSEKEIKKLAMAYRVSLTEDIIKKSPISWTWQFAKELED